MALKYKPGDLVQTTEEFYSNNEDLTRYFIKKGTTGMIVEITEERSFDITVCRYRVLISKTEQHPEHDIDLLEEYIEKIDKNQSNDDLFKRLL